MGKHFCAGLDLNEANELIVYDAEGKDQARNSLDFELKLTHLQRSFQLIERCRFPVMCGVDGSCIGGAIDLVAACDIVYCTERAKFAIKEVDLAIIADIGTLQRLPIITNNWGLMKELALTGQTFKGETAKELGLVSRIFPDKEAMEAQLMKTALMMASKSPIAMIGTKRTLNYARSKQVEEGLEFVKHHNMSQIFTDDLALSFQNFFNKVKTPYPKL